jgi:hypothetical protein
LYASHTSTNERIGSLGVTEVQSPEGERGGDQDGEVCAVSAVGAGGGLACGFGADGGELIASEG